MLELKDLNLFYHDVAELDEYRLVFLVPTEENEKILEAAEEDYRRNTISDEFVGKLGENCAYLRHKFSAIEKTQEDKVYLLKRVS